MARKKAENKAVGRTRGGLNTKIHAIVDGLENPAAFLLSPGNDNDSVHAVELMNMTDIAGNSLLGDKAYGTKEIPVYSREHGAAVLIPPNSSAKEPWEADDCLYRERHLVECFFLKIKWFRWVATRYDKLDRSFLAFIYLPAIMSTWEWTDTGGAIYLARKGFEYSFTTIHKYMNKELGLRSIVRRKKPSYRHGTAHKTGDVAQELTTKEKRGKIGE